MWALVFSKDVLVTPPVHNLYKLDFVSLQSTDNIVKTFATRNSIAIQHVTPQQDDIIYIIIDNYR